MVENVDGSQFQRRSVWMDGSINVSVGGSLDSIASSDELNYVLVIPYEPREITISSRVAMRKFAREIGMSRTKLADVLRNRRYLVQQIDMEARKN